MPILQWANRRAVVRVLTDCCLRGEPVAVMSPESGLLSKGAFHSLDTDSVTLRLISEQDAPLVFESLCCVAFNYENRPRIFFTSILGLVQDDAGAPREVILAIPGEIAAAERRRGFRLPVVDDLGVTAELLLEDRRCLQATPVNLSTGGVLLEFDSGQVPDLAVDSELRIRLALKETLVDIRVTVERRLENSYGFSFPSIAVDPEADWCQRLVSIVRRVEAAWIKANIRQKGVTQQLAAVDTLTLSSLELIRNPSDPTVTS